MPIYNKPPSAMASNKAAKAAADDHAPEAAKMKRTREQAYFNSYNFDAIEVLPYEQDEENDMGHSRQHRRQQQPMPQYSQLRLPPPPTPSPPKLLDVSQQCSTSNIPTLLLSAKSSNGRRRQAHATLSSKENTITTTASSRSGSSSSSVSRNDNLKYSNYLQRLGAFFMQTQRVEASEVKPPPSLDSNSRSTSSHSLVPEVLIVNAEHVVPLQQNSSQQQQERSNGASAADKTDGGNFLLPRAMLKYQSSVGVGAVGGNSSNSMPLAVNTNTTTNAGTAKSLQNVCHSSNNVGNTNTATTTTNITSSTTINNNSNKTRQIQPNSNEKGTGSSTLTGHKKNAPMASTMASTRSVDQQQQQQQLQRQHVGELTVLRNGQNSQNMFKLAKTTTSETATLSATTKTGPTATNLVSGTAVSSHGKQRERISSHQSHYSTDKSGSSGYYSSNVCSTYSIEDHIYCEPVIDVLDLNSKSKSVLVASNSNKTINSSASNNCSNINISSNIKQKQLQLLQSSQNSNNNNHSGKLTPTSRLQTVEQSENTRTNSVSDSRIRTNNMHGVAHSERVVCEKVEEQTNAAVVPRADTGLLPNFKLDPLLTSEALAAPHLRENLRILETSIENLDRHLKTFPSLSSQEQITAFVHTHQHNFMPQLSEEHRVRSYQHLPTIMEGFDPAAYEAPSNTQQPRPAQWQNSAELIDDSLLDIDLDSFLLVNERAEKRQRKRSKQAALIDNPTFLANEPDEELEENNYKCAKYINSCPEDAYRVESDIVAGSASQKSSSMEHFLKRYEDQIHFQNTRELLEDVREKIRLLSRASSDNDRDPNTSPTPQLPQELNGMIKTLKLELETYLARMNQHSELEIRQLCSGLVKNQHIVKMKKAFERRRSIASVSALDSEYDFSAYEALRDGVLVTAAGVPLGKRQQTSSIRCASDPNFKMKRKSLTEVFPVPDFYVESVARRTEQPRDAPHYENAIVEMSSGTLTTAAQRNLSFHQPILNQLDAKVGPGGGLASGGGLANGASASGSGSGSGGESGDKESIMEWHRQKPSAWEMYYGTNRMSQSLLGKRGMIVNTNQASLSYPSSRPESDFTLDLPRAEQLRIKMEKEKKFRQRCRYITSFLSLVFFLLTVMVVSLVLTRGKRMFGSMI